jgi:hypothetical protein
VTVDQVRCSALCSVLMLLAAAPMSAHHSSAMFEDSEVAARATVVDLTWRNPHVLLHWEQKDKDGKVVRWVAEMASISSVLADGFSRTTVKPGDDVIVTYRPAKAGTPEAVMGAILSLDGKVILPWSRQGGGSDELRLKRAQERLKLLEPFGIKVNQ